MTTAFSLSPLFRQSVGFDRFNDLFESMMSDVKPAINYPPYDIVKKGEGDYRVLMAVAGFTQDDLSITLEGDRLSIKGCAAKKEDTETQYLHHGIARREFEVTFRLADHMQVTAANLQDGMLSVDIVHEVPAEAKPRTIQIRHESKNAVLEHDAA